MLTYPGYTRARHLEKLAQILEAVERGEKRRVLITMPPRHGKSELCSVRFPAWYLGRNPDKRVVIASYAADLAERFSRQARAVVQSERFAALYPGVKVAQDSKAVSAWDIAGHRGGLKAVGVGGPLTGHGANVLLIDDPVKNRQDANSELLRQSTWDWYTSTAYTRLEEDGAVVLIMTRWHEDDLMGRLLAQVDADAWEVIHFPAVSDAGEALWPEKYDLQALRGIEAAIGEYDWHALYQGRPTPREGLFFKPHLIDILDAAPVCIRRCRAWDLAATSGDGHLTVGAVVGIDANGRAGILDVVHGQWGPDERDAQMKQTNALDERSVVWHLPQDPGQAGKDQAQRLIRMLAGRNVRSEPVTGPKEVRAGGFAAQVNAGNVWMLKAPWNRLVIDQLAAFMPGVDKDVVDALSDAYTELALPMDATIGPRIY